MIRNGRVIEAVRVPAELAAAVRREARRRGADPSEYAGDLIARALPSAYAEALRELFEDFPTAALPQTLTSSGDSPQPELRAVGAESHPDAGQMIPDRPDSEPVGGATA
ncbi:MAG: hypothetical protein M0Z69_00425 [Actinomycetota bacterium]|nr:hypothetical protein [Actinomycetota bacterium]